MRPLRHGLKLLWQELIRIGDRSAKATSRVTSNCSLTLCVDAFDELEDILDDAYGKALDNLMNPDCC